MAKENLFRRGTFKFIGEPVFGRDNVVTTAKLSPKSDWSRTRLNFGVKRANDTQFLQTEYIHSDKVNKTKLFDKDGNGFDVAWSDTNKPSTLDRIADYTKIIVNLETDQEVKKEYYSLIFKIRNHEMKEEQTQDDLDKIKEYTEQLKEFSGNVHKFAHMKDVIKFINDNQDKIKGHKVRVTGDAKSNYYKEKNNIQYIPSNIELVSNDVESELTVNLDIFFSKDSIIDDEKMKQMAIDGYIGERIKRADRLVPTQLIFDYSKADLEDENQANVVDFVKRFFDVKSKTSLYKLPVICSVVNGAEIVEFDESTLTEDQKMAIMLGMNKLEDFKPKGNIFGNRVSFIKVVKPDLKVSPNGAVETVVTLDTLSEYLLSDDSDVSIKDVKESKTQNPEDKDKMSADDLMKSLFS